MLCRCSLRSISRCALAALLTSLVFLVLLNSPVAAQPYANRLPPPGWTVHPEVVYPSGYRRTVQAVPTVQRIYMWPQYWPDVPYPVDYGATYEEIPQYAPEYVAPPPSPHGPAGADPREIDVPRIEPPDPPSLVPESVPPPVPETIPPVPETSHRRGVDTPPSERRAARPSPVEYQPPVQSEFHIRDPAPAVPAEGVIQFAPPANHANLPPADRRPLSSLPSARGHEERVQSIDDALSSLPTHRDTPIQDAVPPYSAVAPPSQPESNQQAETPPTEASPRGVLPSIIPALSGIVRRNRPETPSASELREPAPEVAETAPLEPPSGENTVLRRIGIASGLPVDSALRSVLMPGDSPEIEEFGVPDVDASQPDEQIVAAFQPPTPSDADEPMLPARLHDPMEFRIIPEEPELERCPTCDDFVDASLATWVDPCSYCTPVRRTPEMIGDVFLAAQCEEVEFNGGALSAAFPAMSLGQKISFNNNPLPRHRVYYAFNWFQDAVDYQFNGTGGSVSGKESIIRHTAGIEIPLLCDTCSVEFRVPIAHRVSGQQEIDPDVFFYNFAGLGNVLINTKFLMGECDCFAWSAGIGVELPTGEDTHAGVNEFVAHVENDAVHLHPFVAMAWTPSDKLFVESFTQLDVTTRGNRVSLEDRNLDTTEFLGRLTPSRVLFVDAMAGYWLYCDDPSRRIHSLASLVEVHYVNALDSGEALTGTALGGEFFFCNGAIHDGGDDTVNLTLGIHAEYGPCSAFRIAGAFPVSDDELFDSELIFQWNRRL